nr:hypothetical protein [uncultured Sphingomonas sp.]
MFDITKPVQTRRGEKARIVATNVTTELTGVEACRYDGQTILAEVEVEGGGTAYRYHNENGSFLDSSMETDDDLINVPAQPVTTIRDFTIYPKGRTTGYNQQINEVANGLYKGGLRVPVRVTFEDDVPVAVELALEAAF